MQDLSVANQFDLCIAAVANQFFCCKLFPALDVSSSKNEVATSKVSISINQRVVKLFGRQR